MFNDTMHQERWTGESADRHGMRRRGRHARRHGMRDGFRMGFGGPGHRGRGRRGGPRAGRGDVRSAVLMLLAEQPMHGYQIIAELDERTGGVWKPSPGSVYPTLQLLEDEGLVEASAEGGKKVFQLTDEGRTVAAEGDSAPWEAVAGDAGHVAMRQIAGGLFAAFKQVAQTGTPEQIERAKTVMNDARKALYGILAEDTPTD